MTKKYYAIRNGRIPGIYESWPEAQKQIKGFSGAIYKSFPTREEALSFMEVCDPMENINPLAEDTIEAYVDGSFNRHQKIYGSGVAFIKNQQVVQTLCRGGNDPRYLESFQIAGEVFAALSAIKWAKQQGYQTLIIYYDYIGIENWATGMWKSKKPISQDYVRYYQQVSQGITVIFQKVKAHSGVKFNELADQLAKDAINQMI